MRYLVVNMVHVCTFLEVAYNLCTLIIHLPSQITAALWKIVRIIAVNFYKTLHVHHARIADSNSESHCYKMLPTFPVIKAIIFYASNPSGFFGGYVFHVGFK